MKKTELKKLIKEIINDFKKEKLPIWKYSYNTSPSLYSYVMAKDKKEALNKIYNSDELWELIKIDPGDEYYDSYAETIKKIERNLRKFSPSENNEIIKVSL